MTLSRTELARRIEMVRRWLEWANGEYAEQLTQDLAYYEALIRNAKEEP